MEVGARGQYGERGWNCSHFLGLVVSFSSGKRGKRQKPSEQLKRDLANCWIQAQLLWGLDSTSHCSARQIIQLGFLALVDNSIQWFKE